MRSDSSPGRVAVPTTAPAQTQVQIEQLDRYQLRELVSQEVTADASFWMAVAAMLTLIVTATGTFFIWRQVKLTRQAVQEAIAGTEAVREANAITREIGQAQARCYLSAKDVKFRIDNDGVPQVTMNVLNAGQSPGRNFRWAFHVRLSNQVDNWVWENQPAQPGGGRDIPTQQQEPHNLALIDGAPMPQGQLSDLLLTPMVRITISIEAVWTDVFEKEWHETWRFQAMAPTGIDVDIPMFPDFPPAA